MTKMIHGGAAGTSRAKTLERAAVASIEAAWACEALGCTRQGPSGRKMSLDEQARSAAKAWKMAGVAWHTILDPPLSGSTGGELGRALKASGRALMRTCIMGLEPAQDEALMAWEAAKTAWNSHAPGPEAVFNTSLVEER